MDIENHVGGLVVDDCVRVGSHVVKKFVDMFLGVLSWSCLLHGNV